MALAGQSLQLNPAGYWDVDAAHGGNAPLPFAFPLPARAHLHDGDDDDVSLGEARQELVFIGIKLDRTGIERALDTALLTTAEMKLGSERWERFADPFPEWALEG